MREEFKRVVRTYALARRVLAVATTREEGAWAAYCDVVPGVRHSEEFEEVLGSGDKLREHVARSMFPEFKKLPYAH